MTESEKKWKSAEAEGKWLGICLGFFKNILKSTYNTFPKVCAHTHYTTGSYCPYVQAAAAFFSSVPVLFYVHIGAVGAQESLASSFSLSFLPKRCKYNTEENT